MGAGHGRGDRERERTGDMAERCWQIRPCDEEMQSRCAHPQVPEQCPVKCIFGQCHKPQRKLVEDFSLHATFSGTFDEVVKEECFFCEVFLRAASKQAG